MNHPAARKGNAASAPTRVCLGGEDLDWLGGPSLLAAIELRVTVRFTPEPDSDTLTIESRGALPSRLTLDKATWKESTAHELDLARLCWQVTVARSTPTPGGHLAIESSAPPGAGLATSATTCVAALRAMADASIDTGYTHAAGLVRGAFDVERHFAGRPVGPMDFIPAVYGGTVLVEAESEVVTGTTPHHLDPTARFVILDTRTPRDTGAVIAWKRRRLAAGDPSIRRYAERTAALVSEQAALLAADGDLAALGQTLDAAQAVLAEDMKVSTSLIDACLTRLRAGGALGAKLTGTGHGGCVVGLTTAQDAERVAATALDLPVATHVVAPAAHGITPLLPAVATAGATEGSHEP